MHLSRIILPCIVKNILTNYPLGYIIVSKIPCRVKIKTGVKRFLTRIQSNRMDALRERLLMLERDFRGTLGLISEYAELLNEERNEPDMECLCLHMEQLKEEYDEVERLAAQIRQYEESAGRRVHLRR